ncbi:MAG: SH3 domain-containing protein [Magnetococcales bacterium]|nr:SH3 domain-containing protein [Magnetococcales bacterium]
MTQSTPILMFVLAGWLVSLPGHLLAETLYAAKSGVEVNQDPSPTSKILATLERDAPVQVLGNKDRYVQVKLANGTKGWVYQFKLAKNTAKPEGGAINLAALTGGGNIHAKEARSGGSIRGMQPVAVGYAKNRHIDENHIRSLEWMEWFQVSDKELMTFKKEGRIGEFLGSK